MWNEIKNDIELQQFMDLVNCFHDGCVKEIRYLSGAYVNADLSMYPMNDCRTLQLVIQLQNETVSMIEMKFEGLKFLRLTPVCDKYTCEISAASMFFSDNRIYWCDDVCSGKTDFDNFDGTAICAEKVCYRVIENSMGSKEYFNSQG